MLISLQDISKNYDIKSKNKTKNALSNINLSIGSTGLVSIVGKSGSGKSTLLNILGLIDKPSSGKYYFNDSDTSRWKKNDVSDYLNNDVGIVFQNYQLLEDLSVVDNVVLPQLIGGKRKKESLSYAVTMLSSLGFSDNMMKQKVSNLSGGEKQRVAILRSIINNPKMILCDEPTGALDSTNSVLVMDMLKKASKKVLVIVVSHNLELVKEYSDRIITIREGVIDSDIVMEETCSNSYRDYKKKHSSNWVDSVVSSNLNRRKRRNLVSLFALSFSLIASTLVLGFIKGNGIAIENEGCKHLDYGTLSISKETTTEVKNTIVSLVKQTRPSKSDLVHLRETYPYFNFELNYDYIISPYQKFYLTNTISEYLSFVPIYSFKNNYIDKELLIEGKIPEIDSFYEVVINKKAAELLNPYYSDSCINKSIRINSEYKHSSYTLNETNDVIDDYLIIDKKLLIVGIVDELDFLSTPTIYYSYKSLDELLTITPMNNISKYYEYRYTWKDLVQYSGDGEPVTSYSYRVFLQNINDKFIINNIENNAFVFSSNSLEIKNALLNIIDASQIGVSIFLIITILGSLLILGIISFSSYSDDVKRSAILSSIGARNSEIASLYIIENMVIGLVALLLTFALSPPFVNLANLILDKVIGLSTLIIMPINILDRVPYSYYLLSILILLIVIIAATSIPLLFSKKCSIREGMQQE